MTTIVAGDMNTELCSEEADERTCALKEVLATMSIEQHLDIAPLKKTWTLRGPKDQERCYDHVLAATSTTLAEARPPTS